MGYTVENENTSICYSSDEICPICGVYSPDGDVCTGCQKNYDIYEPKITYSED